MTRTTFVAAGVATLLAVSFTSINAKQAAGPPIDADDVAGIVRSSKGPEAGVWVIAETKDLPTPYAKIVVTDDQGRYLLPDLPKGNYSVFVRGYGLVDSPRVNTTPGKALNLTAGHRAERARGRSVLSGRVLAVDAAHSRRRRVSRHRAAGQRHLAQREEPVGMDPFDQVRRLHGVPSAWHSWHPADPEGTGHLPFPRARRGIRRIQSGQAGGNMVGRSESAR
jgi:hypothetical protein